MQGISCLKVRILAQWCLKKEKGDCSPLTKPNYYETIDLNQTLPMCK
jgi:hypothetical protein